MISIFYFPSGNPLQVQINTGPCYAVVPVTSFSPLTIDWESIDYEPTRLSIQSAWEAYLEKEKPNLDHNSADYIFRPRPDLVEPITFPPDWREFVDSIPLSVLLSINSHPFSSFISDRLVRLSSNSTDWKGKEDRLIVLWNQSPIKLTKEELQDLSKIAAQYHIPLEIKEDGTLEAK